MSLRLAFHLTWAFALAMAPMLFAGTLWWRAQSQAWALAERGVSTVATITDRWRGERVMGGSNSFRTQDYCGADLAFPAVDEDGREVPIGVSTTVPCSGFGSVGGVQRIVYLPDDPRVFETEPGQKAALARSRGWLAALFATVPALGIGVFAAGLRTTWRGRRLARLGVETEAEVGRLDPFGALGEIWVEFTDAAGRRHSIAVKMPASRSRSLRRGDRVRLRYDPRDPRNLEMVDGRGPGGGLIAPREGARGQVSLT